LRFQPFRLALGTLSERARLRALRGLEDDRHDQPDRRGAQQPSASTVEQPDAEAAERPGGSQRQPDAAGRLGQ